MYRLHPVFSVLGEQDLTNTTLIALYDYNARDRIRSHSTMLVAMRWYHFLGRFVGRGPCLTLLRDHSLLYFHNSARYISS